MALAATLVEVVEAVGAAALAALAALPTMVVLQALLEVWRKAEAAALGLADTLLVALAVHLELVGWVLECQPIAAAVVAVAVALQASGVLARLGLLLDQILLAAAAELP